MRNLGNLWLATVLVFVLSTAAFSPEASARAGGGRSFGGRGSRSYSAPARSAPSQQARPGQSQPYAQPGQPSQPMGGGFLRGMAGGLVGGMVGSMLFRSLGFGGEQGAGMGGGGGMGIFDLLLIGGLLFFAFKFFFKGKGPARPSLSDYAAPSDIGSAPQVLTNFDAERFKETAQDIFFKIQGAWTRGDLSIVSSQISPETLGILQQDLDLLKSRRETNRLENIAVREVEITETWKESEGDYLTVRFLANLLDYNTDESGKVVSGSNADPVKFEEFWTFLRPTGATQAWVLSAIQQGNS